MKNPRSKVPDSRLAGQPSDSSLANNTAIEGPKRHYVSRTYKGGSELGFKLATGFRGMGEVWVPNPRDFGGMLPTGTPLTLNVSSAPVEGRTLYLKGMTKAGRYTYGTSPGRSGITIHAASMPQCPRGMSPAMLISSLPVGDTSAGQRRDGVIERVIPGQPPAEAFGAKGSLLEQELHDALIAGYYNAADQVGYRGTRFLQAVKRNGGLATAKRMLQPRAPAQRAGLDRLLEAGKPELTVESIVLEPRFAQLFTDEELNEAAARLGRFSKEAAEISKQKERLYPDDLLLGRTYTEGAKRQIRVNAYERDPRARRACLAFHGHHCSVCDLSFEKQYGFLGKGFIHVHHLRPLASKGEPEKVDPKTDLVPVCPNCHAMLHRTEPPLAIEQLRKVLSPTRPAARR